MMKIKITDFSYRGEGQKKQLLVAMSIEGSKTVESTAVRVDLYNINGKIMFGEMTFYDGSGFAEFVDEKWDKVLGSWIKLPERRLK